MGKYKELKYIVDIQNNNCSMEDFLEMMRYSQAIVLDKREDRVLLQYLQLKDAVGDLFHDSCGILARWRSFGFKVRELTNYNEDKNWDTIDIT